MQASALVLFASLVSSQQGGHHARVPGETASAFHRYSLLPGTRGLATVDIAGPPGASADVFLGDQRQMSEPLPLHFRAAPDRAYVVVVRLSPELTFQQEILAREGMRGTLEVFPVCPCHDERREPPPPRNEPPFPAAPPVAPPVQGPVAMPDARFRSLVVAMKKEGFDDKKLSPLRSAASREFFTCAQVGELVELFSFSEGKLDVLRAVRGRIADPENRFQLYGHFTFSSDKEAAEGILGP